MKKKFCTICLMVTMLLSNIVPIVNAQIYKDVPETHKSYWNIGLLSNMGVVEGFGDGNFAPEEEVRRADFVIMLSKVLSVNAQGDVKFADVLPTAYYYEHVMNAANAGIVSGNGDGTFRPEDSITTEEAVVMIISAYEKTRGIVMQTSGKKSDIPAFSWSEIQIDKGITANLIRCDINPRKKITRAEAADILSALLVYSEECVEGDYLRETTIIQKQRGNIFTDADPTPEIEVLTGYPIIETIAKDFWGNTVVHQYDKVLDGKTNLKFKNLDFGHYYVYIYGRDDKGNRSLLADTTLSYLKKFEAAAPAENPFGINFHSTRSSTGWYPDLLYEASLIGVKHVRDEWYWSSVEKEKGVYTNFLEKLADECKKYRIALEPVCTYQSPLYDNNMRPYTDEGRTGFANVANAFYDIFDDRELFSRIEMYNEWWNPNTVKGSPAGYEDLTYLKALQEKTQEVVKQNHPEAILLGMISGPCAFTDNYFAVGCAESADEITAHRYPPVANAKEAADGAHPEGIPEEQSDLCYQYWCDMTKKYLGKEFGKDIKWGFTETGYTVDYVYQTEHYQGVNYPRLLISLLHYNPEYVHTYDFICDGNNELNKEHNFGILNAQNSKHGSYTGRPAYVAYGVTARMIDNKDGVAKENVDDIYHYTFKKDDSVVHTFNTAHYENKTIAINTDTALNVTDCMGETREFVPVNGRIYLTLNEDVVYVQGNIGSWEVVENVAFEDIGTPVLGSEILFKTNNNLYGIEGLTYEVAGIDYNYNEIVAPASFDKEERTIKIFAKCNGEYVGQFNKTIEVEDRYSLVAEFDLIKNDNGVTPQVNAVMYNKSDEAIMVDSIRYTIGEESYDVEVNKEVNPGQEITIPIQSEIFKMYTVYEIEFRAIVDGVVSSYVDAETKDVFAPLQKKTMVIDGVIDEDIDTLSCTDFLKNYNLWQTGSLLWEGAEDLSGQGWASYDDENLYLAYKITDDVHLQTNEIKRTWAQDCIQVGFYHEDYEKYDVEYDMTKAMPNLMWICDFSLNSNNGNNQMYKSKTLVVEEDPLVWDGVVYNIKRNESEKTTTYEIAVPWSTLLVDVDDLSYYQIEVAIQDADVGERSNAYYLTGDAIHLTKNRFNFLKHTIIR